jgi:hypothetical protein
VKEVLETKDFEQREAKARQISSNFNLDGLVVSKQDFEQEMAQKLFYRAVTDSTAEKGTAHMLENLAPVLPANPRQIKRIINTLSLLGQLLRIKDPEKRPGSADWELLARWVVLMVEWPKSWFTLSRYPGLADLALAIRDKMEPNPMSALQTRLLESSFLPLSGAMELASSISKNATVMRLLDFRDSDWKVQALNASAISWLREIMPSASGQMLVAATEKPKAAP